MECLKLTENNIIQRFYFLNRTDLKTFKRDKNILVEVFDELICNDVERRINMTIKLFKTNCNIQKQSIENTEAFEDYIITKWD
tara:strand:- start:503 stop:751 length:249 start_codon:yes stop_codon:yes gene_type:complete